nr:ribonuclease H-like domain-containing protein [Tanacetum cinerariifolium]
MALGYQRSVEDAHANEPIPSLIAPHPNPLFNPTLLNWNWDDVIVIPSDDDEADVNELIPSPVEDADLEVVGIKSLHEVTAVKYENFTASSSEVLDQTFDRLQKLISQLEIHGESISQEDVNQKFLRSLSPEWNTHTIVWRNKPEIDTLSLDDLYNNLKIYEPEVKGTSSSNTNTQNVAFVSSNSIDNTNGTVNTAHGATTASTQATAVKSTTNNNLSDAVICSFFTSQQNSPQLDNEDLHQIYPDDLEDMDLRWQMAMLTMRAKRFLKNTGRKFSMNSSKKLRYQAQESTRRTVRVKTPASAALVSCDGLGGYDWSDQAKEGRTNFAHMAYSSISSNSEVSTDSNYSSSCLKNVKILKEQNEQLLKDLRTSKINAITYKTSLEFVEAILLVYKKNESVYEEDIKIVDKCKTGLGYNAVPPPYTENFMHPKPDLSSLEKFVNESIVTAHTVKKPVVETSKAKASTDKPKEVRKNFGSPLIEDWILDSEDEAESKPKIEKKTVKSSFAKIEFVKSKEQVKSLRKTTVKQARPKAVVNVVLGNRVNAVKASGNPQMDLQDKGVIDSGCSRHMTGNMYYLIDYEEINRGYVAFGGNPKGGKIIGKASKDETSTILETFITGIENLVDHKVKVIRCDNGTEFKNIKMNQFCEMKGIMRQYSVARTPQQNRVAERKNRTLTEAARTMLANLKLPTFWAEAVNTACYVQNKVLVVKPHNKTPYEIFYGRTPALSFMRPFGCPVTILNTKDHLGKFDDKADEGFFGGYSLNSKAFRVFNNRTMIVKKNLHIRFSENTPNIAESGPNWLFDIDALTKSMNYKPVVAGNQSNGNAGTKACDDAGKARMEIVPGKDYILLPLLMKTKIRIF